MVRKQLFLRRKFIWHCFAIEIRNVNCFDIKIDFFENFHRQIWPWPNIGHIHNIIFHIAVNDCRTNTIFCIANVCEWHCKQIDKMQPIIPKITFRCNSWFVFNIFLCEGANIDWMSKVVNLYTLTVNRWKHCVFIRLYSYSIRIHGETVAIHF